MVGHSESAVENDTKVSDGVHGSKWLKPSDVDLVQLLARAEPHRLHLRGIETQFAVAKPDMDVSQTHSDNLLTAAAAWLTGVQR